MLHRRFLAAVFSAGELERAIDEAAYLRLDVRGLRPPAGSRRRREGHTVDFAWPKRDADLTSPAGE